MRDKKSNKKSSNADANDLIAARRIETLQNEEKEIEIVLHDLVHLNTSTQ